MGLGQIVHPKDHLDIQITPGRLGMTFSSDINILHEGQLNLCITSVGLGIYDNPSKYQTGTVHGVNRQPLMGDEEYLSASHLPRAASYTNAPPPRLRIPYRNLNRASRRLEISSSEPSIITWGHLYLKGLFG